MKKTESMTTSQLIQQLQHCAPGAAVKMCASGVVYDIGSVRGGTDWNGEMTIVLDEPKG